MVLPSDWGFFGLDTFLQIPAVNPTFMNFGRLSVAFLHACGLTGSSSTFCNYQVFSSLMAQVNPFVLRYTVNIVQLLQDAVRRILSYRYDLIEASLEQVQQAAAKAYLHE